MTAFANAKRIRSNNGSKFASEEKKDCAIKTNGGIQEIQIPPPKCDYRFGRLRPKASF
jgi:hypothetical protein